MAKCFYAENVVAVIRARSMQWRLSRKRRLWTARKHCNTFWRNAACSKPYETPHSTWHFIMHFKPTTNCTWFLVRLTLLISSVNTALCVCRPDYLLKRLLQLFFYTCEVLFPPIPFLLLPTDFVRGGELFNHLTQREKFSETETRVYIAEMVLAIETLHKVTNQSIWRDICPALRHLYFFLHLYDV